MTYKCTFAEYKVKTRVTSIGQYTKDMYMILDNKPCFNRYFHGLNTTTTAGHYCSKPQKQVPNIIFLAKFVASNKLNFGTADIYSLGT